jgi:hypothetical protein
MSRLPYSLFAWVATLLTVVGLMACGGGSSSPEAVAHVGNTAITKPAVAHWMATLVAGDYNELSGGRTVPAGLVSEPPSYQSCVAHLEAAAVSPAAGGQKTEGVKLLTKCQHLYQALRTQATEFLVRTQWQISLYREQGVTATDAEVTKFFEESKKTHPYLSTATRVHNYLTSRRLSLTDYLYILKLDLLGQKFQQKLEQEGKAAFAGIPEAERRWTAKTSCLPGYVVQHCKQYRGAPEYKSGPTPSILVEQIAALVTGRCINRPACTRQ